MRGRGKAPLAMALLHLRPLVIQIQGQGAGDPLAPGQEGASGNDEAETRNALDALVRAADQEVDSQLADVNGNAAEAAHGVHDERQAATADRPGDGLHRIQNAGGGLAVHHGQVGDVRVFLQRAPHGLRRHGRRLLQGNEDVIQAMAAGDVPHALAVRTVGDDQQLVLRPDGAAQRGFHGIGAAAL